MMMMKERSYCRQLITFSFHSLNCPLLVKGDDEMKKKTLKREFHTMMTTENIRTQIEQQQNRRKSSSACEREREWVNKNNIEWWSGRIEVISGDQEEAHSTHNREMRSGEREKCYKKTDDGAGGWRRCGRGEKKCIIVFHPFFPPLSLPYTCSISSARSLSFASFFKGNGRCV